MNLKKRIAVCLCLLLVMPALLECIPALTLQANAAEKISLGSNLPWGVYTYGENTDAVPEHSFTLEVGQELDFSSYFCYWNSSDYISHYFDEVNGDSYKSSNSSVASISKSGVLKAKKKGTAAITVKYKGKKEHFKVNIEIVPQKYTKRKAVKDMNKEMTSLWNSYGNKNINSKNITAAYNKVCDLHKKAMKCNSLLGVDDSYPAALRQYVYLPSDNSYRVFFNYGNYNKICKKINAFASDKKTSIVATVSTKNLTAKSVKTSGKNVTLEFNKAVSSQQLVGAALVCYPRYNDKISTSSGLKLRYSVYSGKNLNVFNYYKTGTLKEEGTVSLKPNAKKITVKLKKKLAKGNYFIGFYPQNSTEFYSLSFSKAFILK